MPSAHDFINFIHTLTNVSNSLLMFYSCFYCSTTLKLQTSKLTSIIAPDMGRLGLFLGLEMFMFVKLSHWNCRFDLLESDPPRRLVCPENCSKLRHGYIPWTTWSRMLATNWVNYVVEQIFVRVKFDLKWGISYYLMTKLSQLWGT